MLKIKLLLAMALAACSINVQANPIVGDACGVPDRVASLTDAQQCAHGLGNPDASDIATYYPGDAWVNEGELTSNGSNDLFAATSDIGWGVIPNNGTWAIDPAFWTMYDEAVITMHIGNGGGDPDHWAWLVADGETSGTWWLDFADGGSQGGGGLSNLKLWGRGEGSVPAPGVLALLAIGLVGMAVSRRRKVA